MGATDDIMDFENDDEYLKFIQEQENNESAKLMAELLAEHSINASELLISAHELAMMAMEKKSGNIMPNIKNEQPKIPGSAKRHPSRAKKAEPSTALKKKDAKKIAKKAPDSVVKTVVPHNSVRVKVISCSCSDKCVCHNGDEFIVVPQLKSDAKGQVCRIGRSTGATYKKYGISLYKDDEVSTKHASLFRDKAGFWIVDMNSSNGTRAYPDGYSTEEGSEEKEYETLVPMQPYKLTNGLEIGVGGSILKFTW